MNNIKYLMNGCEYQLRDGLNHPLDVLRLQKFIAQSAFL